LLANGIMSQLVIYTLDKCLTVLVGTVNNFSGEAELIGTEALSPMIKATSRPEYRVSPARNLFFNPCGH
jgi:hypothetical protein